MELTPAESPTPQGVKTTKAFEFLEALAQTDGGWYEVPAEVYPKNSSYSTVAALYRVAGQYFTPLELRSRNKVLRARWNPEGGDA